MHQLQIRAIKHKCGKRQTDKQTCVTSIHFVSSTTRTKCNGSCKMVVCVWYRIVLFNRMALFMISSRYKWVTCIILPLMRICWQWCHITGINAVLPLTSRSTGGRGKIEASGWFLMVGVVAFSFFSCFNVFGWLTGPVETCSSYALTFCFRTSGVRHWQHNQLHQGSPVKWPVQRKWW